MAGEDKGLSIVPVTEELMGDVNTSREPFLVFGRVIPSFQNGQWTWREELLETQDNNLAACRFYHRCGFVLGGVDALLYSNTSARGELALFWYKPFDS